MGTWEYEAGFPSSVEAPRDQVNQTDQYAPCYHWRKVTDPEGFYQVHYFQTARAGFTFEGNLPLTYCDPETGTFLGDQVSGVPGPGPFLSLEEFDRDGIKFRETYKNLQVIPGFGFPFTKNYFVTRERTVSIAGDGTEHYVETTNTEYDGFGHHRYQTTSTDFPDSAGDLVRFTNYNQGRGSLDTNGNGQLTIPQWNDPWILETFSESRTTQDGNVTASLFCFDSQTGFLNGQRNMAGTEPANNDVLVHYGNDGFGNVNRESYFGGDDQLPGGDDVCAVAGGLSPVYEMAHGYSAGVRASSAYIDCDGQDFLLYLDQTIDESTGLVAFSRDPSGVETQFVYDVMGRQVFSQTEAMARFERTFLLPVPGDPYRKPTFEERTCADEQPGCSDLQSLTLQSATFDWLGRLERETVRRPNADGTGTRITEHFMEFNLLGWPTHLRVWRTAPNGENAGATQYLDYDALGRPGRILKPDGTETSFSYTGEWLVERDVQVQGQGTMLDSTYREFKDGFGRVVRVEEQSAAGSGFVKTTYGYDDQDRLVSVCINDTNNQPGNCPTEGQRRSFDYDGRGFLISETQPEWGESQPGTAVYTYDPRGNMLSRAFAGDDFDLTYQYDLAERVTQISNAAGLWKEYFFGRQNMGPDRRAGKIVTVKRHNRIKTPESPQLAEDIVITETFAYEGAGGRVSNMELRTSRGALFQTGIDGYDALGNITRLTYPTCGGPDCDGAGPQREVQFEHVSGVLSEIHSGAEGIATLMGYHPDGRLRTLRHGNGVSETLCLDNQIWRLDNIQTSGIAAGQDWHSGSYTFDAAGNVAAIGSNSFAYDRVNRLVRADIQTAIGPQTQTAAFDIFGNMTNLDNGNSGPGSLAVTPSRNRWDETAAAYDVAGNVTELDLGSAAYSYEYDPFNLMNRLEEAGGATKSYLYTASDRRIATLEWGSKKFHWTIRGPDGDLLRRFTSRNGHWKWEQDYISGAGRTIASVTPTGTRAFHLDHLGTTRRVTDSSGTLVESNDYFPFGFYASDPVEGDDALRFTGHERDANGTVEGDLDYMLARYYQPFMGRFLGVDPVLGNQAEPQSWNRYSYAKNSPINFVDPDGREAEEALIRGATVAITAKGAVNNARDAINLNNNINRGYLNLHKSERIANIGVRSGASRQVILGAFDDAARHAKDLVKNKVALKGSLRSLKFNIITFAAIELVLFANDKVTEHKNKLDAQTQEIVNDPAATQQAQQVEELKTTAREKQRKEEEKEEREKRKALKQKK